MTAHVYWIPAGADFDPYAPKLSDIYNAIKHVRKYTLGFDAADRAERTYAAPLHFFNHIKEHDMTETKPFTDQLYSVWGDSDIAAALKILSKLDSNNVPEAQIGVTNGQQGKHPWTATVGSSSISHKSSPENHLRLALEHLVAAQTIPTLVQAWEAEQVRLEAVYLKIAEDALAADKAREEAAELDAFLCSPEALSALKRFNKMYSRTEPFRDSWEDAHNSFDSSLTLKQLVKNWIEYDTGILDKEAENAKLTAQADAAYRAKQREEWAVEFSPLPHVTFSELSPEAQTAIDYIISRKLDKV